MKLLDKLKPMTQMRYAYFLACYFLFGGILALLAMDLAEQADSSLLTIGLLLAFLLSLYALLVYVIFLRIKDTGRPLLWIKILLFVPKLNVIAILAPFFYASKKKGGLPSDDNPSHTINEEAPNTLACTDRKSSVPTEDKSCAVSYVKNEPNESEVSSPNTYNTLVNSILNHFKGFPSKNEYLLINMVMLIGSLLINLEMRQSFILTAGQISMLVAITTIPPIISGGLTLLRTLHLKWSLWLVLLSTLLTSIPVIGIIPMLLIAFYQSAPLSRLKYFGVMIILGFLQFLAYVFLSQALKQQDYIDWLLLVLIAVCLLLHFLLVPPTLVRIKTIGEDLKWAKIAILFPVLNYVTAIVLLFYSSKNKQGLK